MEEYPQQIKFCYTAEDLHEEYGLSLEGKLPKDLIDEDLPPEQWLTVFKYNPQKNSKIYLNHLQPHLVEDCRFLFSKVYQGPPSCGELTNKFARCYAFEKCHATKKDPVGHRVAWARFGEGVLQMIASRNGGLDRKVEAWRRQNGSVLQSVKKARMTQSGSNICTEPEQGSRGAVADYLPDLEALLQRILKRVSYLGSSNLTDLRASIQANKDQLLLVYEGKQGVAKSLMEDISILEARIGLLRQQIPIPDEEIREVEAELAASRRLLQRHGVSENIQKLQAEVQQQEVLYFWLIALCMIVESVYSPHGLVIWLFHFLTGLFADIFRGFSTILNWFGTFFNCLVLVFGIILELFWYFFQFFWYYWVLYGTVGFVLGSILAQSRVLLVLF